MRDRRPVGEGQAWSVTRSWEVKSVTQAPLQLMQTYLLSTQKVDNPTIEQLDTRSKHIGIQQ